MQNQKILILNFGGQYDQLIARRVRECHVYCEVRSYTMSLDEIKAFDPIGIIFTGGPDSVYAEKSYHPADGIFELGIPILGICYGCQLLAHHLGGKVTAAADDSAREYGKTVTYYDTTCALFKGLPESGISWMSHGDYMAKVPDGFAHGSQRQVPERCHKRRSKRLLRRSVPSRGEPHRKRHENDTQLSLRGLRCRRRLDYERLHEDRARKHKSKGRGRQGTSCPLGRSGFLGSRRSLCRSRRQKPHMCFR